MSNIPVEVVNRILALRPQLRAHDAYARLRRWVFALPNLPASAESGLLDLMNNRDRQSYRPPPNRVAMMRNQLRGRRYATRSMSTPLEDLNLWLRFRYNIGAHAPMNNPYNRRLRVGPR